MTIRDAGRLSARRFTSALGALGLISAGAIGVVMVAGTTNSGTSASTVAGSSTSTSVATTAGTGSTSSGATVVQSSSSSSSQATSTGS